MRVNCTLEELNKLMSVMFHEEAIERLRLEVNIDVRSIRDFITTYPNGLPENLRDAYDYATQPKIKTLGNIDLITSIREKFSWTLKESSDFVKTWIQ